MCDICPHRGAGGMPPFAANRGCSIEIDPLPRASVIRARVNCARGKEDVISIHEMQI